MINVATNPSSVHMIQTARIAATLTQKELGYIIGGTDTLISRYENDYIINIPDDKLIMLYGVLGINVFDILTTRAKKKKFGVRLRKARRLSKLTQSELVERIQKFITTNSRYENSKTYPNSNSLRDLAEVLEVTVAYLLGDEVHSDARLL